jgi:hypothetical protein
MKREENTNEVRNTVFKNERGWSKARKRKSKGEGRKGTWGVSFEFQRETGTSPQAVQNMYGIGGRVLFLGINKLQPLPSMSLVSSLHGTHMPSRGRRLEASARLGPDQVIQERATF